MSNKGKVRHIHWPWVSRRRMYRELTAQRRQMIGHLRSHPRGLVLLDNVIIEDCQLPEVTVLGDYSLIANNYIGDKA